MIEIFSWSWPARLGLTALLALCVLTQTLAMVLHFYIRRRSRWLKSLPEALLLLVILWLSLLHGEALYSYELGLIAPPLVRINAWVFLAVLSLLFLRSVWICLRCYREIRTGISALSIKNTIDSLRTGVLFGTPDGFILLSNACMQQLMIALTGKVRRNGWDFYYTLLRDEMRPGCRKTELEGQIVCLLPDGTAWMFNRTELHIRRKTYIQLTAADITRRWNLTEQLQQQNAQLQRRSEELKEAIANLHVLSREREMQKAKMRTHDILGQRMTLLLRSVRNGQNFDGALLAQLSKSLLEDLKTEPSVPSPQDFLESLRQEFRSVGVEIRLEGELPDDGPLFADIVREGVTNAVRHGFATEILIQTEHLGHRCYMAIANNGPPPPENFTLGGGLTGMRRRLEACGGHLRVTTNPRFVLEIDLPAKGW